MASVIKSVSFDASDARALAAFWAAALGSDVDEDSTADKAFVAVRELHAHAGSGGQRVLRRARADRLTMPVVTIAEVLGGLA